MQVRHGATDVRAMLGTLDHGQVYDVLHSLIEGDANNWLVDQGMKDGERIIVEGGQLVRAGQTVTGNEVTIDEASGELKAANRQAALPAGQTASPTTKN